MTASGTVLSKILATSYIGLFKFKWIEIKLNEKSSSSFSLATFQILHCLTWLPYWAGLFWENENL